MGVEIISKRNRVLLYQLVKTDFKLRYQGSFLGILWSVLKPLMIFAVMYTVFVHFLKVTDGTPTYPIVLLLGISLWQFFTEATSVGMQSIFVRGDLIRKINFPKHIIVMSSMISALISLAINLAVVCLFALFARVDLTWNILLVPISILQLFALAFGLALFLSAFYIKFRDIGHIYEVILQIIFYAMPIIYPLSMVANRTVLGIPVQKLLLLNPIAQTIQDVRHNLVAPTTTPTAWTTMNSWIIFIPIILTGVIIVGGLIYFNKNSKYFAENI